MISEEHGYAAELMHPVKGGCIKEKAFGTSERSMQRPGEHFFICCDPLDPGIAYCPDNIFAHRSLRGPHAGRLFPKKPFKIPNCRFNLPDRIFRMGEALFWKVHVRHPDPGTVSVPHQGKYRVIEGGHRKFDLTAVTHSFILRDYFL